MNHIIDKNYKKWHNYAKIITNNNNPSDLLHDTIIYFIDKDMPNNKLSDNFVFISLRNRHLNNIKKSKIEIVDNNNSDFNEDLITQFIGDTLDYELVKNNDDMIQSKLDCITTTVLSLNQFERKLYQLHFIYGLSQRNIAREIGVNHLTINQRINRIKQKIRDNYVN
jgi:RNA polymerase sigma factor (sigma-70 family)